MWSETRSVSMSAELEEQIAQLENSLGLEQRLEKLWMLANKRERS